MTGTNPGVLAEQFAAGRKGEEAVRLRYAAMLRAGTDIASVRASLRQEISTKIENSSERTALSILQSVASAKGDEALVRALEGEPRVDEWKASSGK